MSICWSCYWGWPKPVADIYDKALLALDDYDSPLQFGPSHIVWGDENFDQAEWCLEHFEEHKGDYDNFCLNIVRKSLEELTALPLSVKCVIPENYDGEHPELFPPPENIIMVKR